MLFATWPRKESEPSHEALAKAFEAALMYCEPWSVDRAVGRFIRGTAKGHDMAFRPTGPQVAQLATELQNEESRISEITNRVSQQTNRIEYQGPPKHQRAAQSAIWNAIKAELRKPNIHELAMDYVAKGLSVPGTTFTPAGARFPDGTFHSIERMRLAVSEPIPNTEEHMVWQERMEKAMEANQ